MLFDTHAHLCDERFDQDRDAVLARASAAGVDLLMEIGDSPADWEKVLALSKSKPGVIHASLGYHPHYAQDWNQDSLDYLRKFREDFAAVGEIGLDYVVSKAPRAVQIPVFRRMLGLAVELHKPVVIHCREAFADMFLVLTEYAAALAKGGAPGVIHCFTGGPAEAEQAVKLGFYLGVDGPVTYPKNDPLRDGLKAAGLDRLVLETDSPYLPPQKFRGQRNEPARLADVAAKVAELFGCTPEEVAKRTRANGLRLFRLPEA